MISQIKRLQVYRRKSTVAETKAEL
jgi:hypothetical protein